VPLQGLQHKKSAKGIGKPKREILAAVPVRNGDKIHKSVAHRYVGDISCPHLIGVVDFKVSQQIGVYLLCRMWPRGLGLRIYGFKPHEPHQSLNTFTIDFVTQSAQVISHRTAAP